MTLKFFDAREYTRYISYLFSKFISIMDDYRQPIEQANRAFGHAKVMEISLLKTGGLVETMMINAAGLIKAFELGAIHCYRRPCRRATQELLRQVRQLPVWDGICAKEILILVQRFVNILSPEWEDEVWQSWAFNMRRWGIKKILFVVLSRDEIGVFCGKRLLLESSDSFWRLSRKVEKDGVQQYWQPLWVGREFSVTLYQVLVRYNPAVKSFVIC